MRRPRARNAVSRLLAPSSHPEAGRTSQLPTHAGGPRRSAQGDRGRALACGTGVVMRDHAATSTHHSGLHHTTRGGGVVGSVQQTPPRENSGLPSMCPVRRSKFGIGHSGLSNAALSSARRQRAVCTPPALRGEDATHDLQGGRRAHRARHWGDGSGAIPPGVIPPVPSMRLYGAQTSNMRSLSFFTFSFPFDGEVSGHPILPGSLDHGTRGDRRAQLVF